MDAAQSSETLYCAECGRPSKADELARFGDLLICATCKNNYAQKLREGAVQPAKAVYAGFWIRFVGVLIDGVIMAVVAGILQVAVFGSMLAMPALQQGRPPDVSAIAPMMGMIGLMYVVQIALASTYEALFIAKLGATPGKMVIGVKVLRPDGAMLSVARAYGRYFAKILSTLTLMIGFIIAGFDSQKRALHDMICDTRVVKSRR